MLFAGFVWMSHYGAYKKYTWFIGSGSSGLYLRGNESGQFDTSNFPLLSAGFNRSNLGSLPQQHHPDDFTLLNEDFPALPGSLPKTPAREELLQSGPGVDGKSGSSSGGSVGADVGGSGNKDAKYGLAGLLDVIKMTDRELNILALGSDLTTFGLNLNSAECLFSSFR
jgi:CCR4-NOT transcription complex subunit 2